MFAKTNSQIRLQLLGKYKGNLVKEVGARVPYENDNSKGASNQRRGAKLKSMYEFTRFLKRKVVI
jgi:hypothetical protein